MTLKRVWKELKRKYSFTDGVDAPIIIRYCTKHLRYEWYDPCNKWGGIAHTLDSLKNSLKTLYWCSECCEYHVYHVAVVSENVNGNTQQVELLDFVSFVGWREENNMNGNLSDSVIELMVLDVSGVIERARLQRIMFLLKEKCGIPINLHFESYFYGPYSEELTYDIEVLKAFKVVEEERVKINDYYESRYKLTPKGKEVLKKLLENDEKLKEIYQKIKLCGEVGFGWVR